MRMIPMIADQIDQIKFYNKHHFLNYYEKRQVFIIKINVYASDVRSLTNNL